MVSLGNVSLCHFWTIWTKLNLRTSSWTTYVNLMRPLQLVLWSKVQGVANLQFSLGTGVLFRVATLDIQEKIEEFRMFETSRFGLGQTREAHQNWEGGGQLEEGCVSADRDGTILPRGNFLLRLQRRWRPRETVETAAKGPPEQPVKQKRWLRLPRLADRQTLEEEALDVKFIKHNAFKRERVRNSPCFASLSSARMTGSTVRTSRSAYYCVLLSVNVCGTNQRWASRWKGQSHRHEGNPLPQQRLVPEMVEQLVEVPKGRYQDWIQQRTAKKIVAPPRSGLQEDLRTERGYRSYRDLKPRPDFGCVHWSSSSMKRGMSLIHGCVRGSMNREGKVRRTRILDFCSCLRPWLEGVVFPLLQRCASIFSSHKRSSVGEVSWSIRSHVVCVKKKKTGTLEQRPGQLPPRTLPAARVA